MAKQRKHGSGTVRLRSDGRWEGRVVIGYDDSGLPKTKNTKYRKNMMFNKMFNVKHYII